jgi:hypothetical protein
MPTTKWAPVCDTTLGFISIFEALTATALAALPAGQAESVYTSRRWQCCCNGHDIKDIRVVRAELQQFDAKQRDFAVRFHIAVVDANLRAASEGHDDPIFREGLAMCIEDLAACVRNPGRGCGSLRCFFCEATLKARA